MCSVTPLRSIACAVLLLASLGLPRDANAQRGAATTNAAATLREAPSTSAKRLSVLRLGDTVTVHTTRGAWSQVTSPTGPGWIASRLLTVVAAPVGGSSTVGQSPTIQEAPKPEPAATPLPAPDAPPAAPCATVPPSQADRPAPSRSGGVVLGARTWLVGGGLMSIGVFGEKLLTGPLPQLGNGRLGATVSLDVFTWSAPGVRATVIPMIALATYHAALPDVPQLDLFAGLGAGAASVRASLDLGEGDFSGSSGAFFVGTAGARYFFSNSLGVQGQFLFGRLGSGDLSLGVAWRP